MVMLEIPLTCRGSPGQSHKPTDMEKKEEEDGTVNILCPSCEVLIEL